MLLLAGGAFAAQDYVIDLVTAASSTSAEIDAVPESERLNMPQGLPPTFSHETVPKAEPLFTITSASVDRTTYAIGEDVIYLLTIEYVGTTPFDFPVSAQEHLFRKSMADAKVAAVALELDDLQLGTQVIDVRLVMGAPGVPNSLVTLQPHDTVTIRAPANWYLMGPVSDALAAVSDWTVTTRPSVSFGLHYLGPDPNLVQPLSDVIQLRSAP
jgi:hypothetical protein